MTLHRFCVSFDSLRHQDSQHIAIWHQSSSQGHGLPTALSRGFLKSDSPSLTCRDSTVAGVERFGLFVEFLPGRQGLLHISELAAGEELEDFDADDKLDVKLVGVSKPLSGGKRQFLLANNEQPQNLETFQSLDLYVFLL